MGKWKTKAKKQWGCQCHKCGSKDNVTLHHLKPRCLFPELSDSIENMRPLCRKCHDSYHDDYLKGHIELCNNDTYYAFMCNELHEDVVFYHIQSWLLDEYGFGEDWLE